MTFPQVCTKIDRPAVLEPYLIHAQIDQFLLSSPNCLDIKLSKQSDTVVDMGFTSRSSITMYETIPFT
jgi:hypothetical protein